MDSSEYSFLKNYAYAYEPTENELLFNPDEVINNSTSETYTINPMTYDFNNNIMPTQYMKFSTDIDTPLFETKRNITMNQSYYYEEPPVFPTNYDGTVNTNLLPVNRPIPANMDPIEYDLIMAGLKDYPCGKRGRPRKVKVDTPKEKIEKISPSSSIEKKKRGRPRKVETTFESTHKEEDYFVNGFLAEDGILPKISKIETLNEDIDLKDYAIQVIMEDKGKTKKKYRKKTAAI